MATECGISTDYIVGYYRGEENDGVPAGDVTRLVKSGHIRGGYLTPDWADDGTVADTGYDTCAPNFRLETVNDGAVYGSSDNCNDNGWTSYPDCTDNNSMSGFHGVCHRREMTHTDDTVMDCCDTQTSDATWHQHQCNIGTCRLPGKAYSSDCQTAMAGICDPSNPESLFKHFGTRLHGCDALSRLYGQIIDVTTGSTCHTAVSGRVSGSEMSPVVGTSSDETTLLYCGRGYTNTTDTALFDEITAACKTLTGNQLIANRDICYPFYSEPKRLQYFKELGASLLSMDIESGGVNKFATLQVGSPMHCTMTADQVMYIESPGFQARSSEACPGSIFQNCEVNLSIGQSNNTTVAVNNECSFDSDGTAGVPDAVPVGSDYTETEADPVAVTLIIVVPIVVALAVVWMLRMRRKK